MDCISPITSSDVTPSKILFPNEIFDERIWIIDNDEHFENVLEPIDVTEGGITIDVNDEQPKNALSSIDLILLMNATDSNDLQLANIFFGMTFIFPSIVSLVIPLKDSRPTVEIDEGKVIKDNDEHP